MFNRANPEKHKIHAAGLAYFTASFSHCVLNFGNLLKGAHVWVRKAFFLITYMQWKKLAEVAPLLLVQI